MIHAHLFLTKRGYSRDGTDGHGPVSIILINQKVHNLLTLIIKIGFSRQDEGN